MIPNLSLTLAVPSDAIAAGKASLKHIKQHCTILHSNSDFFQLKIKHGLIEQFVV
jgi:hypothetical protein